MGSKANVTWQRLVYLRLPISGLDKLFSAIFLLETLAVSSVNLTLGSCTHTFFSLTEKLARQDGEMAQQVW